jgi:hypothetical protein
MTGHTVRTQLASGVWSSTPASRMNALGEVATLSRTGCSRLHVYMHAYIYIHILYNSVRFRRKSMRLATKRKIDNIGNSTLTIRTFLFSPLLSAPPPACTAKFCVFFFYRTTGRPVRIRPPDGTHPRDPRGYCASLLRLHTGFPMSAHLSRIRLFQRHLRRWVRF